MNDTYSRLKNYTKMCRIIYNNLNDKMKGVEGLDEESLLRFIQDAQKEQKWVENYIKNIKDLYIKEIAIQKFIKNKTWRGVAVAMGSYATEDCYRKALTRYIIAVDLAPNGVIA